jgi:hypothetical protein
VGKNKGKRKLKSYIQWVELTSFFGGGGPYPQHHVNFGSKSRHIVVLKRMWEIRKKCTIKNK